MMIVTRVAREMTRGRTETGLLKLVLSVGGPPGEAEGRGGGGGGGKVMVSIPAVVTGESVAAKVVALLSSIVKYRCCSLDLGLLRRL